MPWCDSCDRLVERSDLVEGRCPTCDSLLEGIERGPLPWRFRLMIGATVIYLIWRLVQLVSWLSH